MLSLHFFVLTLHDILKIYTPSTHSKTQLARAVAGEAQAAWFTVGPSDVLSKYVGESEAAVRRIFQQAAALARAVGSAVVFWDELDALGVARGSGANASANSEADGGGARRVLAELLLQFNTIQQETEGHIILIAATNRPEDLDPALLRRFGLRLYVGYPNDRDRRRLLRQFLRGIRHALTKQQLHSLAAATDGWSGSELEHLTREAAMAPVRECLQLAVQTRRRQQKRHHKRNLTTRKDDPTSADTPDTQRTIDADNDDDEEEALAAARANLVQHLQTLRPVTVQDFQDAIDFTLGQAPPAEAAALLSPNATLRIARYESSSSSSDDDEEEEANDDDDDVLKDKEAAKSSVETTAQPSLSDRDSRATEPDELPPTGTLVTPAIDVE